MIVLLPLFASAVLATDLQPPVEARLRDLATANPNLVQVSKIGLTREGRPIQVAWITQREAGADTTTPEDRPALVVIAGLNGMHRVGVEAALGLAEKLAADHPDVLKQVSVYVVPCVNLDSFAWRADPAHPNVDWGRTIAPYDADRDGRVGEDPAEDLNGDGVISMMRVKSPSPASGLRAEWAIDPDNPKLLKKPDASKGERAEYALVIEGVDNDRDGRFNEDGLGGSAGGGIDLDMNFPFRWPEFQDGAGRYPLSEPESLALTNWMLSLNNVAVVLVYGPGDTLINIPQAGRMDPTGQVPLGIEENDKAAYEAIAKVFKDTTGITAATALENAGSLQGWAYADYGVLSFETPVWVRPDLVKKEEKKDGEKKDAEKKEGQEKKAGDGDEQPSAPREGGGRQRGGGGRGAGPAAPQGGGQPPTAPATAQGGRQPGPGGAGGGRGGGRFGRPGAPGGEASAGASERKAAGEPAGDDAKWIKYNEERVKAGDPSGFIDWKPFKHPTLSEVEIGGWMPGFKLNPPASEMPRLVEEQTKFVTDVLGKLPRLTVEAPWVERVGPNLWRITVRITNDGFLASMPAIGAKARRTLPTLFTFDGPLEQIVSGEKNVRAWAIPGSGGKTEATWLISGNPGDAAKIVVRPSIGARKEIQIKLTEGDR